VTQDEIEPTYEELREYLGEYEDLTDRQAAILDKVARALNGPPPPRTMWSHHDLGEKAEAAMGKHGALVARMRAALKLIYPDDITPMGRRILERILDAESESLDE
jgi:hypothetical protein